MGDTLISSYIQSYCRSEHYKFSFVPFHSSACCYWHFVQLLSFLLCAPGHRNIPRYTVTLFGLPALSCICCSNINSRQEHTKTDRHTHIQYMAVHTIIIIGQLIRGVLDILALTRFQSLWQWGQVEGQASFNGVFWPWCILGQRASWPPYPARNNITFTPHPLSQPSLSKHDCDRFECITLRVDISHRSSVFLSFNPSSPLHLPQPPKLSISKCLRLCCNWYWELPTSQSIALLTSSCPPLCLLLPPLPALSDPQETNNLLPVCDGRGGQRSPYVTGVRLCAQVCECMWILINTSLCVGNGKVLYNLPWLFVKLLDLWSIFKDLYLQLDGWLALLVDNKQNTE